MRALDEASEQGLLGGGCLLAAAPRPSLVQKPPPMRVLRTQANGGGARHGAGRHNSARRRHNLGGAAHSLFVGVHTFTGSHEVDIKTKKQTRDTYKGRTRREMDNSKAEKLKTA
eukprot:scaffold18102_cov129-Isochrysis_galbana.AAC.3